ncbi:hypothetical protein DPMN_048105 [Dreissena polymorpha]|uniref:Uncharacterized protein n=1 Tax=Dreissena polymorpha TaxID=45954 RepID=A0A9D4DAL9_DREPO|nr:hypothetical protein DPMN_048105 [Dreissena polymorpha]
MLKLAQTNQPTDQPTDQQTGQKQYNPTPLKQPVKGNSQIGCLSGSRGLDCMSLTTIVGDQPTDQQTGQKQYVPHYYIGGHKNIYFFRNLNAKCDGKTDRKTVQSLYALLRGQGPRFALFTAEYRRLPS